MSVKEALGKREFLRYARRIEEHFSQKRGTSLMVGPNDFKKIEAWFEEGIPLRAVEKGIDAYWEKLDPKKRRKWIVLRFAEMDILDEWEFMRAGGASPSRRKRSLEEEIAERKESLQTFVHTCRKADGRELWAVSLFERLAKRAEQWLKEEAKKTTLPEMAEKLEDMTEDFLRKNASVSRMRGPRHAAELALAEYKDRMTEKTYLDVIEQNAIDVLRNELGVPRLMEEL